MRSPPSSLALSLKDRCSLRRNSSSLPLVENFVTLAGAWAEERACGCAESRSDEWLALCALSSRAHCFHGLRGGAPVLTGHVSVPTNHTFALRSSAVSRWTVTMTGRSPCPHRLFLVLRFSSLVPRSRPRTSSRDIARVACVLCASRICSFRSTVC